jgi:hypothetical protein
LPNSAHFDYDSRVSLEIASSPSVITSALGTLTAEFNTLLAQEKSLMDWVKKDVLTKQIKEADARLDRALTSIKAQVHAQEFSLTPGIADAARRVYTMLSGFGNINRKPYRAQSGDIRDILGQLTGSGAYASDANILGLAAFLNELQAAFTLLDQLIAQRGAKRVLKPEKTFREVRSGIEKVYHQIVKKINAGAEMNTASAFVTFINHLNPEIDLLNTEFHHARHDLKHAQPAPIGEQIFTGLPLTPLTDVLYVTQQGTVRLELGKDFDVTYKNNVEVGVAECTFHGKGAYKGSRTVTFVIVHAK